MSISKYSKSELPQLASWLTGILSKAKSLTISRVEVDTDRLGSLPSIHDWVKLQLVGPVEVDDMNDLTSRNVVFNLKPEEGQEFPVGVGAAGENYPVEAYSLHNDRVVHIISRYYAGWIMVTTIYLND